MPLFFILSFFCYLHLSAERFLTKHTADIALRFAGSLTPYIFFLYKPHSLRRLITFLPARPASALPASFLYRAQRFPAANIFNSGISRPVVLRSLLLFSFFFSLSTSPLRFPIYRIFIFSVFFLRIYVRKKQHPLLDAVSFLVQFFLGIFCTKDFRHINIEIVNTQQRKE